MPKKKTDTIIKNFESGLQELEKIVSELENPDIPLDKALSRYEHAIKIYRACSDFLKQAEQKIQMLVQERDQKITLKDVGPDLTTTVSEEDKQITDI